MIKGGLTELTIEMTFVNVLEKCVVEYMVIIHIVYLDSWGEHGVPDVTATCTYLHLIMTGISFIADPVGVETDSPIENSNFFVTSRGPLRASS